MTNKSNWILSIVFFFFSTTCFANGVAPSHKGFYLGGNYSQHDYDGGFFDDNLKGGVIRAGFDFTNYFGLEGQIGLTMTESYIAVDQGQDVGTSKQRAEHTGIYARFSWRLMNFNLYGLAGVGYYNRVEKNNAPGYSVGTFETDEVGPSFGVGIDLFGSTRTALSLTWMKLINEGIGDGEELNISAMYLGITHYFKPQRTNHRMYGNL